MSSNNPLGEYGVSDIDYAHAVAIAAAESSVNPPDEEMQGILDVVANRQSFPGQYAARDDSIRGVVTARNQFDPVRGAGSSFAGDIYASTLAHALDPGRNPLPSNLQGKFDQANRAAVAVFGTGEARGITNNATFFSNPSAMSAGRIAEHNTYGLGNAQVYGGTHFYGGWSGSSPEAGYSAPIHLGFAPNATPPARPGNIGIDPAFTAYGQDRTSGVHRGSVQPAPPGPPSRPDGIGGFVSTQHNIAEALGRLGTDDDVRGARSPGILDNAPQSRPDQQPQQASMLSPDLMGVPGGQFAGASAPAGLSGVTVDDVDASRGLTRAGGAPTTNFGSYGPDRSSATSRGDIGASRLASVQVEQPTRTTTDFAGMMDHARNPAGFAPSTPASTQRGTTTDFAGMMDHAANPSGYGDSGGGVPTPPSRPAGIGAPTPPSRPSDIGGPDAAAGYRSGAIPSGPVGGSVPSSGWQSTPDNIAESLGRLNQQDEDFSRSAATTRSAPTSQFTSYGQDRTSAVHGGTVSRSAPAAPAPEPPSAPVGAPAPGIGAAGRSQPAAPARGTNFGSYGQDRTSMAHSGTAQAASSRVDAPMPPSRPADIGSRPTIAQPQQPQTRLAAVAPAPAAPAPAANYASGSTGRNATVADYQGIATVGSTDRSGGTDTSISYGTGRSIGLGGAFAADIGAAFGGPGRTGSNMNEQTDSGGGGGGGGTIICGHYHERGLLDTRIYRADLIWSARHASMRIMAGYYAWAVPLRAHLRRNPDGLVERTLRPLVVAASTHMAYKVGAVPRTSLTGRICFNALRGASWLIGGLVATKKSPA